MWYFLESGWGNVEAHTNRHCGLSGGTETMWVCLPFLLPISSSKTTTCNPSIINFLSQTNEHSVIVNVDIPAHTSRKPGEIKSDSVLTRLPTVMHIWSYWLDTHLHQTHYLGLHCFQKQWNYPITPQILFQAKATQSEWKCKTYTYAQPHENIVSQTQCAKHHRRVSRNSFF